MCASGSSSSSSSNSSGTKTGDDWTKKVYFDPIADEAGPLKEITDGKLLREMKSTMEKNEKIEKIWVYKCPLNKWQLTQFVFHHQFVMFETKEWWWSIEKNSQGITVQRAKNIAYVMDRYRREDRIKDVVLMNSGDGQGDMEDLARWLHHKDELNKKYHFWTENCKHFAKRVFDEFAKSK